MEYEKSLGRDIIEILEYIVKTRKGLRRLRITVYDDLRVVVTAPKSASKRRVEEFVASRQTWVEEKLRHFREHPHARLPRLTKAEAHAAYQANKAAALALAEARLAHWNAHYGFRYASVRIKDQKTRWGSCSKRGNLNFNYRIALVPLPLADYVIVHELCHLRQMNHSKKFWDLVAETVPDWKERRNELRGWMIR